MNNEELDTITDLLFGNGYDMLKTINDLSNKLKEKDKEIERLVNKIDEVVNKHQFIEEKFNYKSRCEKAIEYIENSNHDIIGRVCSFTKLINILTGDDND